MQSVSYEDLNSSFEKSDLEQGDAYGSEYESSSPTRNEPRAGGGGYRRKSGRKTRTSGPGGGPGTSTGADDPLLDYDAKRPPYGLSFDYKYEYHKSQHMDRTGKELVDVICENLYKRTGMHGAKVDEVAISRKVVERSGGDEKEAEGDGAQEENKEASTDEPQVYKKRDFKKQNKGPSGSRQVVVVTGDGGRGKGGEETRRRLPPASTPLPPRPPSQSPLSGPPLSSFFRRPKLKREPMLTLPPRVPVVVHREEVEQRWTEVRQRERRKRKHQYSNHDQQSSNQTLEKTPENVSLWYELNKRPWGEYYQHLDHLDRYCLFSAYNNNHNNSYCSSPLLFSAAAATQLKLHKVPPDWHIRASSRLSTGGGRQILYRTHSDPESIFDP